MLAVLCVCGFSNPLSAFIVSPLLVDLSVEFHVGIAQAGQLITLVAIPAGVGALVIGPLSDLYGRRTLLLSGAAVLGMAAAGCALASSYEWMVAARVLTGLGLAALAPSVFAATGDLFPYAERGRALAYLTAAHTVSAIAGIPFATLAAAQWGWRSAFALLSCVMVGVVLILLRLYPRSEVARPAGAHTAFAQGYTAVWRSRNARALLVSSFAMSIGWMTYQTYLGAFFITRYGIGTGDLAPILAAAGVGLLAGSLVGGRLGDHIGHKSITVWSVAAGGGLIFLELATTTTVELAALINVALSFPMGMRVTSANTLLSEAAPSARGTINALNGSFFSAGMVIGVAAGGLFIESAGYAAVGVAAAVGQLASALILAVFFEERPQRADANSPVGRLAPF
jgi:DHA1 family inner membrane transport protein